MHAGVQSATIQPGKVDEVIKFMRDAGLPKMKKQKGFKGLFVLTNRETGKYLHISLWNTEADATAAVTSGDRQEAVAKAAALFVGPGTVEGYEVSIKG